MVSVWFGAKRFTALLISQMAYFVGKFVFLNKIFFVRWRDMKKALNGLYYLEQLQTLQASPTVAMIVA